MLINLILEKQKIGTGSHLTTFLNPYSYLKMRTDPKLLEGFDAVHADGIALTLLLKIFGIADLERRSFDMTSMAPEVFEALSKTGESLYLIGADANALPVSVANIQAMYPNLTICGSRHGYFSDPEERSDVIDRIVALNPDVVVCGMGTILQEKFLLDLKAKGWNGRGYTCGGFLHQSADRVQYYPGWIDRFHLRWVYRIYKEPKLFSRYAFDYPLFLAYFIKDYCMWKLRPHKS